MVGLDLAIYLQRAKHDVSLVEIEPARSQAIREKLDILVVEGPGSSPTALEAAGISEADIVLAVTSVDEVNILVCGIARQFGVRSRIARIRGREFTGRRSKIDLAALGITHAIDPERIIVRIIDQIAALPEAVEVFSYHDHQILIARHVLHEQMPIVGHSLADAVKMAGSHRLLAVALKREHKVRIPFGNDTLQAGDDVTTVIPRDSLPKYIELLDLGKRRARKAVVAGEGLTAVLLAETLRTWVEDVTLVDPVEANAREAAERLENVEVIHGDPTDRDVLEEVHVGGAEIFVGAGKQSTDNVMSALLARSMGTPRVFAVAYEPQSNRLFREIGVNYVITPRTVMAQEIMDLIHRGHISMELQLRDLNLETMEIRAAPNSPITRGPLTQVWRPFKRKAIAGAVVHGGVPEIPSGNTRVQPGDDVIIVTEPKWARKVQRLFE
jgi:trk system potassium uptake protein TrkA